ncbi:rRNA small subunit 7-methylguanosine (m7G) methyltransferase GidB [Candidatus Rhodobacter oscarellae]|uniref:Ribosomal RNA small subunit methyltransferase G n=1 Tax=Candidatus Rhodobacter oscarellae TaxID=1675527 RepID=A0A0J9GZJ9_9RHOB|nr:16S rRNA (guanine(527)-N(7))-methyltransferase RsmG [Candidatus Rhodobacter lobularis]KMW58898.1 rRNA small subunit 7-methylguanosine (m7G) methyltransferase GidB [Candidatus Rhodobacter lobularis]
MNEEQARFCEQFSVSRETSEKLQIYDDLLNKWNRTINLVSGSTLDAAWHRHMTDSAAAYARIPLDAKSLVDLGAGGGFPGMVLAIMAAGEHRDIRLTCIEADLRKCEFLRTVARATELKAGVLTRRIEDAPPQNADVVVARALSSLTKLLTHAERHLHPSGFAIFHKGEGWKTELEEAQEHWKFSYETSPSMTHPEAVLLSIGDITRV